MIKYINYNCKTILNRTKPAGVDPFIGTVNPYTGCEHGCRYCYVQSEKYLPYKTPDELFYTVKIKDNAPALLNYALEKTSQGMICIGSSADPYQPAEKEYLITREILNIINRHQFSVHIFTKSDLITRDLDILKDLAKRVTVLVSFSIITLDKNIVDVFEPNAPGPKKRINAMNKLSENGITVGCSIMPILPYITDKLDNPADNGSLEELIRTVKSNGAKYVWSGCLTLRDKQRQRYESILSDRFKPLIGKYRFLYSARISPEEKYCNRLHYRIEELLDKYNLEHDFSVENTLKVVQPEFSFV